MKFETQSDSAGRYVVTSLPPGTYSLAVEASGFKRFVQSSFRLEVQQQATIDVQMQVGDLASTVEVTGVAPLLNTTIANLGQVVDNTVMVSMPNIGRNPLQLAYITPGVVGSAGRRGDTSTNFVANGARNSTSDVLVDGVTVTTVEQNSGITDLKYTPSVDSVQEFKMQTNFFSAEYGQTGGAVINMVTKSGSNEFHGTAFYFLRHSDLNANGWFTNRAGRPKSFFKRDQFGGVIGGPVVKNKTFFFATYQGTKQKQPLSYTATFPTLLERDGDFSQTRATNGQMITIYNPFDTMTENNVVTRRPFAGNVIPKTMFDPVTVKALQYFPKPNQVTNAVTNTNNWFNEGLNKSDSHQMDFKADHNFNERTRVSGRYSYARNNGTPPNLFGDGNPAYTFNDGPSGTRTHSIVGDLTRTETATTIWTLRYGLIYSNYFRNPMEPFDLTTLGLPTYMKTNASYLVFPTIAPGEQYTDIGTEGWLIMDRQEGTHQVSASVTKIAGAHNLKIGGEFRQAFLDYLQPGYPSGQITFRAQETRRLTNVGDNLQGNGVASMLLGFPTGGSFHIDPKAFTRSRYMGFYLQDDWKVSRRLTLNLGLRYEFDIPRWETQNRQSYWDLDAQSYVNVPGLTTKGVFRFVDDNRRSPFNGDYDNFSPRLGFAYQASEKTSIRGAWAMLYQLSRATVYGHTGSGFTVDSNPTWTLDSYATRFATLSNPYPQGMLLPPGSALGDRTFVGLGAGTILPSNNRNPEYYSWNLSIQRELPFHSVLEVNYTGSRGAHLFYPFTSLTPLDPRYWLAGSGNEVLTRGQLEAQVPNPFYGVINEPRAVNLNRPTVQRFRLLRAMPHFDGANTGTAEPPAADSYYHGLQMKWEKRFSRGFTFLGHYTWSKMIDDASIGSGNYSWLGGSTSVQNPLNRNLEKSLSAHDIAHRAVFVGNWALPIGTGRKWGSGVNRLVDAFIGGWELSGFLTLQSGNPLQISQSGGQLWNGSQRPNLVGDPSTSGAVVARLNGYFNEAAFTRPPADTFGTAPRYLNYRGPGIKTLDAALLKSWKTKEGQRAEFRLEAQNATNTPIFGDPATAYGATNFGQITGTKIGSRNVQLGFKYYF